MATNKKSTTQLSSQELHEPVTSVIPTDLQPKHARYVHLALLILGLTSLISAQYALYSNFQLQSKSEQEQQTLLTEIDNLKQLHYEATNKIEAAVKSHTQSQNIVDEKLALVEKAMQERMYQTNDWILLKARYLMELAEINAHWSNDLSGTADLIKQADTLLAPIHDQRLFNVRQIMAKEIAQINAIPKVDITGLLSQLDAAQDNVFSLPVKTSNVNIVPETSSSTPSPTSAVWRNRIKQTLHSLEKLVVIRRNDEIIPPLPAPGQDMLLRENLRLILQTTQWAILHQNQALYDSSLTQAIKSIHRSFDLNAASTQSLISHIQNLQKIKLLQEKPQLNQSLTVINDIINSKKLEETPTTETGGDAS